MKKYTIYARKIRGKFKIDNITYIEKTIDIQKVIDNNFPLCFEGKNKGSALEMARTVLYDIDEYLPKCIVLKAEIGW